MGRAVAYLLAVGPSGVVFKRVGRSLVWPFFGAGEGHPEECGVVFSCCRCTGGLPPLLLPLRRPPLFTPRPIGIGLSTLRAIVDTTRRDMIGALAAGH